MLALFALGITPKILIHSLVAGHKDTAVSRNPDKADKYGTAGFHCTVDNLVLESPFVDDPAAITTGIPQRFAELAFPAYKGHLSSSHFIVGLRGPPSVS